MSQQTPMIRVVPYWNAWMRVWPNPAALAKASSAEVITAWGKLGYPRRALRLQECARVVTADFGGELPDDSDALLSLPGVGEYTAAAVAAFAFGRRVAVVDTNIRRVISRVFDGVENYGGATTAADRARAAAALPAVTADSVLWNQAVMELGATVCTASSPQCETCPLNDVCAWRAADYPGMGEKPTRKRQKWRGTNRQVRGRVLDALRQKVTAGADSSGRGRAQLSSVELEALWPDQAQLRECVAGLDDDHLIDILPDGGVAFPNE
jgi:A/G-specific adenine glycosylase